MQSAKYSGFCLPCSYHATVYYTIARRLWLGEKVLSGLSRSFSIYLQTVLICIALVVGKPACVIPDKFLFILGKLASPFLKQALPYSLSSPDQTVISVLACLPNCEWRFSLCLSQCTEFSVLVEGLAYHWKSYAGRSYKATQSYKCNEFHHHSCQFITWIDHAGMSDTPHYCLCASTA